ncbi:MAG: WXG100 family type VII secretion target [Oscillospiraceae bacterium]|nr:WXG100 family type VII secretion target [Oscillospiraceae bacterium]
MGKDIRLTDPQKLSAAGEKLAEQSQIYTQIYGQLLQEAGTMGTAWDGEDNIAFVNQINGFTEELKQMADKLQLTSEAVKTQAQNYANRQDTNTASVKNLAN